MVNNNHEILLSGYQRYFASGKLAQQPAALPALSPQSQKFPEVFI